MAMVAARPYGYMRVSDDDMRHEPAYTDTTLARWIGRGVPPAGLFFIAGADAFAGIRSWRNYPVVLDRCHFAVVSRPGVPATRLPIDLPELAERMVLHPAAVPATPAILLIDAPTTAVSSTDIRERLGRGQSIAGLVPPAVDDYIRKHSLYGEGPKGG
jgi:nicotinate-nucleotide adenylyltransferase